MDAKEARRRLDKWIEVLIQKKAPVDGSDYDALIFIRGALEQQRTITDIFKSVAYRVEKVETATEVMLKEGEAKKRQKMATEAGVLGALYPDCAILRKITPLKDQRCGNCRFWPNLDYLLAKTKQSDDALCLRFPHPEPKRFDNWCGEWKEKGTWT